MVVLNSKSKLIISFVGLKNIIYQLKLLEKENSNDFLKACKILNLNFPDKKLNFSLTSSAKVQNQIRFYTKNKIERELIKIIKFILKHNDFLELKINNYNFIDDGTKHFLNIFQSLFPNKIRIIIEYSNYEENILYSDSEIEINNLILNKIVNKDVIEQLLKNVEYYLNFGDFYTSLNILSYVEKYHTSVLLYKLFSIAYNMSGDTIKSEYYLNKWYTYGSYEDKASCLYSLSILYARHNESYRINDSIGLKYINEGYEILNNIHKADDTRIKINKIFNRNGYALFLFKEKRYLEAIDLEKNLISELEEFDEDKVLLQKTVLLFNLGQCYTAIKDFENGIKTYQKLISLDPFFAEYHLELAKLFISIKDYGNAIKELKVALDLDNCIPEIYSLLGYIHYLNNNLDESLENYKLAFEISKNIEIIYDYLFILTEIGEYEKSLEIVKSMNEYEKLENINIISIVSEIYYNTNNKEKSLDLINKGIKKFPNNDDLLKNLEILTNE